MKVLITGTGGLLGHGLARVFAGRHDVRPVTRADADITDLAAVRACFGRWRPEIVIHPAAIPDIDECERNPALAQRVNVEGTRTVVQAAREIGAAIVHISTDAVFDGKKNSPYDIDDPVAPLSVYGRTKVEAERIVAAYPAHWILRIPLLFGPRAAGHPSPDFVEKGLRLVAAGKQYIVASDQLGSALYTLDAGRAIEQLILKSTPSAPTFGLYHLSNAGSCTRYELARRAAEIAGLDASLVVGKPLAEMGPRAPRLRYAVMTLDSLAKVGVAPLRQWPLALEEFIHSLGGGEKLALKN